VLSRLRAILKDRHYEIFDKPYQLNIIGLRSKSVLPNRFDDEIHVFYKDTHKQWLYHIYKATTDPGTFWLNNPSFEQGTAILAQGQYKDSWAIGKHHGAYDALVQVRPITVIRDYDRDTVLDFNNGRIQTGMFGINIHRAERSGTTKFINKYSAGCQVFQTAEDFAQFMQLCYRHRDLYGNHFTYTLIDFRAVSRVTVKRFIEATASVLVIGAAAMLAIKKFIDYEHS